MASKSSAMWECECGHIEYGAFPPTECSQCDAIESFMRVPEDLRAEREEENVLAMKGEEYEDEDEEEYDE